MRRGLTLIETIYSTLLFSFIVLTVLNLYPSSFVAIKRGEGTLQADALAQAVIEDMRSRSFTSLQPGATPSPYPTPWIYGDVTYSPTTEVFLPPTATASPAYLVGVRVAVAWNVSNSPSNPTRRVVHEAYIHNVHR